MPIYEYHCKACDASIEKLQKLSDDPLVVCPDCGAPELKKKISAAGFRLSGSGWYETDFKKSSDKKKNLVENKDADKSSDKKPAKEGKSESGTTAKSGSPSETKKSTSSSSGAAKS